MSSNQYPGIDSRLVSIVRIKCNRLVGRYGIRTEDLEDFQQEWIYRAIQTPEYVDRHNPRFTTFIGRIIDRMIIQEIRRRKAEKRHFRSNAFSLDDYIGQSDEAPTGQNAISEEDFLEMSGDPFRDHRTAISISQDTESFLNTLPPELRQLAQLLKTHPMEHIAEVSNISRATAFRRMRKLREAAEKFFSES